VLRNYSPYFVPSNGAVGKKFIFLMIRKENNLALGFAMFFSYSMIENILLTVLERPGRSLKYLVEHRWRIIFLQEI